MKDIVSRNQIETNTFVGNSIPLDLLGSFSGQERIPLEQPKAQDGVDVTKRLEQISLLQDGWLDGKGVAPQKDGLRWLANAFESNYDSDLPSPCLYPTPEGGVQAEWTLCDWSISVEIDLLTHKANYQALNLENTDECTELDLDLNGQKGWSQLNAALKALSGQDQLVSA